MKLRYLSLALAINFVFAASNNTVLQDPQLLYQMPQKQDKILLQKITVNRKFRSINELIVLLNQVPQITTKLQSISVTEPIAVDINMIDGTILSLLNQTTVKLGYKYSSDNGEITFYAINPNKVLPGSDKSKDPNMTWEITTNDRTLRAALNRWCKTANWQLIWNVNADYPITSNWMISGKFEHAVNEVLKASQETSLPLFAKMHDSNRVLEIYSPSDVK